MWKTYFCTRDALSSSVPVSLKHQLQLIQTQFLSIALYPAAVRDLHYEEIDRFVNKCLCRIVGCSQRWTSASFLRAELGMYSSKYYAHRRALSHLWQLHNHAWFREHLLDLRGKGPLTRLENLAKTYGVDTTDIQTVSRDQWKARIKEAVTDRAETDHNATLKAKGLPIEVQGGFRRRHYIEAGGPAARAGLQLRWQLLHRFHKTPNHSTKNKASLPRFPRHLMVGDLPASTRALRERTFKTMAFEITGRRLTTTNLPEWVVPHIRNGVRYLWWPGITQDTLRDLLTVIDRVLRWEKRAKEIAEQEANHGEQE